MLHFPATYGTARWASQATNKFPGICLLEGLRVGHSESLGQGPAWPKVPRMCKGHVPQGTLLLGS